MVLDRVLGHEHHPGDVAGAGAGGDLAEQLRFAGAQAAGPDEQRDAVAGGGDLDADGDRISLFARACGLSAREAELLDQIATGASTRDIARVMFVSEHTVQDHLKSIFNKTGTRTRQALLARVLGR